VIYFFGVSFNFIPMPVFFMLLTFMIYFLNKLNFAAVKGDASSGTGAIRVVAEASGKRALIRGLKGMVQDLAFSHLREEVILACVDPQGSLFVHSIEEGVSELK
jgi:hypothetical protein